MLGVQSMFLPTPVGGASIEWVNSCINRSEIIFIYICPTSDGAYYVITHGVLVCVRQYLLSALLLKYPLHNLLQTFHNVYDHKVSANFNYPQNHFGNQELQPFIYRNYLINCLSAL